MERKNDSSDSNSFKGHMLFEYCSEKKSEPIPGSDSFHAPPYLVIVIYKSSSLLIHCPLFLCVCDCGATVSVWLPLKISDEQEEFQKKRIEQIIYISWGNVFN